MNRDLMIGMVPVLAVFVVVAAWCCASLAVAVLVGGAVRLREGRPRRTAGRAALVTAHR